jgi:hypothetical protein
MNSVGLSSKKSQSQTNPTSWRSGVETVGSKTIKTHPFQTLNELEIWPSDTNGSSDEVPLKAIRVQQDVEQTSARKEEKKEESRKYW